MEKIVQEVEVNLKKIKNYIKNDYDKFQIYMIDSSVIGVPTISEDGNRLYIPYGMIENNKYLESLYDNLL